MREHAEDVEQKSGETGGEQDAADADSGSTACENSNAHERDAGHKSEVAGNLQAFGIEVGERGNFGKADFFAVDAEPNQEGDDFVKHADQRERDDAHEAEEAVEIFHLAGERISPQAGPGKHD